jgi:hypothetical protein
MDNYTLDQQIEIVEELIKAGWTFEAQSYGPTKGWWRLKDSGDPVKAMRRGDPKPFHQGAVAAYELYYEVVK